MLGLQSLVLCGSALNLHLPLAGKMSGASLPSNRPAGHQGPYGDREVAIPLLLRPSSAVQSLTHLRFDG